MRPPLSGVISSKNAPLKPVPSLFPQKSNHKNEEVKHHVRKRLLELVPS